MKKFFTLLALAVTMTTFAQGVAINEDSSTADPSALLDVKSTTKGFLPPRMTLAERDAMPFKDAGLLIYCSDGGAGETQIYDGSSWTNLSGLETQVKVKEVVIGSQTWSRHNLDVTTYRNGDPIPEVSNLFDCMASEIGAWCYAYDDPVIGNTYGKLYNLYALQDARGLAPEGWHLPSEGAWRDLVNYVNSHGDVSDLMAVGSKHWLSSDGTDKYGMRLLGGGYAYYNDSFNMNYQGTWWATGGELTSGSNFSLRSDKEYQFTQRSNTGDILVVANSVRLVKD